MPRWLDRALPHFDIEGEAVEREIAHADWPEPRTTAAVVASGLGLVDDEGRALYRDANLRLEPGQTAVLTGTDPHATRALALTIAARVAPTGGLLKVEGHLLPERAPWVRARVGLALLRESTDPVADLRRAVRGRTRLLVVDGLDLVAGGERGNRALRDQAAAVLRDAASARPLTIVATAGDADAARDLIADARCDAPAVLEVSAASPAPPDHSDDAASHAAEVNA